MSVIAASGSSIYRGDLSGILNEYTTNRNDFIGLKLLPSLLVSSKSDYFWRMKRAIATAIQQTKVGTKGTANRVTYAIDQDAYNCQVHKLETLVPDDKKAEYSAQFALESALAENLFNDLMRAHEKRCADLLLNATTFPASGDTGLGVSVSWETTATNTAVDDIIVGKEAIRKRIGSTGGTLTLAVHEYVADKLCLSKQVRESIGMRYAPGKMDAAEVGDTDLAKALGVDMVVRGKARYNSAPENATAVMASIWDKTQAFLCVVGNGSPVGPAHIGRTIAWGEFGGLFTVDSYREEKTESTVLRVKQATDEQLFISEAGFRFTGVAA